jgi:hypothetical protein
MQSMLLVLIVTFAVSGDAQNISAQPPLDPPVLQSAFLSASASPTELPLCLQETHGTPQPNFLSPKEGPLHPEMRDTPPQPKVPGLTHADGSPGDFGPTSTGSASVSKVRLQHF